MPSKEIIQAQLEIVQGYYSRIFFERPSIETILNWLEDDRQTLFCDYAVYQTNNIIENGDKHDWAQVTCPICNYGWFAVYPSGGEKLECPNCKTISSIKPNK